MSLVSPLSHPRSTQRESIIPSTLGELFSLVEDWKKILVAGMRHDHEISPKALRTLNTYPNLVIIRFLWLKLFEDKGRCKSTSVLQWSQNGLDKTSPDIFSQTIPWPDFWPDSWPDLEGTEFRHSDYRCNTINPDAFQTVLKQIQNVNLWPLMMSQKGPCGLAAGLILGHVYGYLLGHPNGTYGGQGRKLSGCYYTPLEVVDWMVAQTLEPQLEQLQVDAVTILDPACGAGIFLVIIYQRLLHWYTARSSDRKLTFETKKQILLRHIYGVDLDPLAVEVTRLALLLVLMDSESLDLLDVQSLNRNIQWGNTLVGDDIFDDLSLSETQCDRIRPFNWQTAFPQIFTPDKKADQTPGQHRYSTPTEPQKGFDIVIGNPPYIDAERMSRSQPEERQYCAAHYATASGNWDIFCVFCEKALQLCRLGGLSSFIVPNKLASADYAQSTRHLLAVDHQLLHLRDYSAVSVFPIAVYPLVYVVKKLSGSLSEVRSQPPVQWERVLATPEPPLAVDMGAEIEQRSLPYAYFRNSQRPWAIASNAPMQSLFLRIHCQGIPLGEMATVVGAATVSEAYDLKPFIQEQADIEWTDIDQADNPSASQGDITYFRFVNSGTIDPYRFLWNQKPVRYLKTRYQAPVISFSDEPQLPPKRWRQAQEAKIIVAGMTLRLECALDRVGEFFPGKSTTVIRVQPNSPCDLRYLIAILNSRLMSTYYRTEFGGNTLNGGYLRIGPPQIKQLPIVIGSEAQQSVIINLVDELHEAQESFQNQINKDIVHYIDQQIYSLYNLSVNEIRYLEEAW